MCSANAEAVLDIETRAAIFIQRQFRHYLAAIKSKRRASKPPRVGSRPRIKTRTSRDSTNHSDGGGVSSNSSSRAPSPRSSLERVKAATGGQLRLAEDSVGIT